MPSDTYQTYLLTVLAEQLPTAGLAWLDKQLAGPQSGKEFYLAFSGAPRFVGKEPLHFTTDALQQAHALRPGFAPQDWTADQAVRTVLLLRAPHQTPAEYTAVLNRLFATADLGELAAMYAALPLLPYPETHVKRAAEGVRTTMTRVFDAIALHNPYPHDYLPTEAWNQLVLKAVFNARPLHQIYGLDQRRNPALAAMLVDYAHERWAAGRALTPEVWRLVGPYLTAPNLADIQRLLLSSNELEKQAAALALAESDLPAARTLLSRHTDQMPTPPDLSLTWQSIGERAYAP